MASHYSAKQRAEKALKARARNRTNLGLMKASIKKVREAIEKKDVAALDSLLVQAQSTIARTRRKGSIHVNTMSRYISRLARAVQGAKAAR